MGFRWKVPRQHKQRRVKGVKVHDGVGPWARVGSVQPEEERLQCWWGLQESGPRGGYESAAHGHLSRAPAAVQALRSEHAFLWVAPQRITAKSQREQLGVGDGTRIMEG